MYRYEICGAHRPALEIKVDQSDTLEKVDYIFRYRIIDTTIWYDVRLIGHTVLESIWIQEDQFQDQAELTRLVWKSQQRKNRLIATIHTLISS